jgi:hypothetical protein
MTQNITNDLATRLLAQENLLINRAPVRTASFDVRRRILTLPMWQNMTAEIEDMLKAHEVGHALYTDMTLFEKFRQANKTIPFSYINIIEDARIEKMMKRKYPGLRKTFNVGYAQLHDRNFFELDRRSIQKALLIDRINIWFKVGYASGVTFTQAERYLVDKVERADTVTDVFAVAKQILDYERRRKQEQRESLFNSDDFKKLLQEQQEPEVDEYDDDDWAEDGIPDEDEQDDELPKSTAPGSLGIEQDVERDEDLEATTDGAFSRNLDKSADTSTKYVYVGLPDTSAVPSIKYDYKTVHAEISAMHEYRRTTPDRYGHIDAFLPQLYERYDSFKVETNRVVNYLIKEFEMKKAASAYKRQHVAKTGVLDATKLASYRIREDLFKQITITKDGQKHGMMFVIDWSGSMVEYLEETVKQLISLVTFCYRAKIPFEVYAFTDAQSSSEFDNTLFTNQMASIRDRDCVQMNQPFHMIEFFNSRMTLSEFNRACRNIYVMSASWAYRFDNREDGVGYKYDLNGTPLNESLVWAYNNIGQFKARHGVEKMTLIKLTDGDGSRFYRYYDDQGMLNYLENNSMINGRHVRTKAFLRDPVTKKVYAYGSENVEVTNAICKMIQDRHDCAVVGYHVVGRGRRELSYTVGRYGLAENAVDQSQFTIDVRKGFNENMFFPVDMDGHDELFLLPNNMKVSNDDLDEDLGSLSSGQVAKKFSKYLGSKKTSRVLLNRFVSAIA